MTVEQKSPIPRRAIAKGIAWSVPAFAIATAAPALAQSVPVTITFGETACKWPGNSGTLPKAYQFPITISNDSTETVTISIVSTSIVTDKQMTGAGQFYDLETGEIFTEITLEPDATANLLYLVTGNNDSADQPTTISSEFHVSGSSGREYDMTVSHKFPGTPPCEEEEPPVGGTDETSSGEVDSAASSQEEGVPTVRSEGSGSGERAEGGGSGVADDGSSAESPSSDEEDSGATGGDEATEGSVNS